MSHVLIVDGLEGPTTEAEPTAAKGGGPASTSTPSITVPLGTPLSVAARELILSTLQHCGGERKRTAEMLGICTKTLYNRLREYGIREDNGRSGMGDVSRLASARAAVAPAVRAPPPDETPHPKRY